MALLQTWPIQWPPLNMGHGPLFARRQAGHRTGRLRPATGWAGIRVEAVPRRLPSWGSVPLRERPARKSRSTWGVSLALQLNLGARLAWAAQLHLYMYFDSCTNEVSQSPGMSPLWDSFPSVRALPHQNRDDALRSLCARRRGSTHCTRVVSCPFRTDCV